MLVGGLDKMYLVLFFFSSRRRHTRLQGDWSSDVCSSDLVHVNGVPTRSCVTPVSAVQGKKITTIEGLSPDGDHPLQKAWIAEQVPQCGYCQSGQIMAAAALLARTKSPTREQIVQHMSGNLCRCGTYNQIVAAIQRAAREA